MWVTPEPHARCKGLGGAHENMKAFLRFVIIDDVLHLVEKYPTVTRSLPPSITRAEPPVHLAASAFLTVRDLLVPLAGEVVVLQ